MAFEQASKFVVEELVIKDNGAIGFPDGSVQTTAYVGSTSGIVIKHLVKLGEAITKGQAIYISSANGTNMIASKAANTSEATSSKTMGLLETGGVTNAMVYVITEGLLSGLDTSAASAGDPVWLGTGGNLLYGLAQKPSAPAHLVFIGIVTRSHANQGEIFVRPQNGFELEELHNVKITNPTDGQFLKYQASTGLWINSN